jgi:hypothetical protein
MMVIVCSRIKSRLAKTVPSPHSAFLPAEGIPYTSVTERSDTTVAAFGRPTEAPGVFTRLGSLGRVRNHTL